MLKCNIKILTLHNSATVFRSKTFVDISPVSVVWHLTTSWTRGLTTDRCIAMLRVQTLSSLKYLWQKSKPISFGQNVGKCWLNCVIHFLIHQNSQNEVVSKYINQYEKCSYISNLYYQCSEYNFSKMLCIPS